MKRIIVLLVVLFPLLSLSLISLKAADEAPPPAQPEPPGATWLIRNTELVDTASAGVFDEPERMAELTVQAIDQKDRARIIRLLDKNDIEISFSLKDNPGGASVLTATVNAKTPKGRENLSANAAVIFEAAEKALRDAYAGKFEEILKRLKAETDAAQQDLDKARSAVSQKKSQLAQDYNIVGQPRVADEILAELQKEEVALQLKAVAVETEISLLHDKFSAPEEQKAAAEDIKKRLDEINAEMDKTQDDLTQYDTQIAEMEKQIEDMAAEYGEDDPAVQELRKSLKIAQDARAASAKKLDDLKRAKWELENGDQGAGYADRRAEAMKRLEELRLQAEIIRAQREFIGKEIETRSERVKAVVALLAEIDDLKNKEYFSEQEYRRAAERYDAVSFEYDLKKDTLIRRAH
jgi:chromosome segregation ATPase